MRAFLLTFLALVACGGGDGARPLADAPPASDGPTVDAAPQPVTLTITRNGQPVAGVHTYFLNPDSSVVATLDTDAAGTASKVMPLGGSVTAIDPFPPQAVPTLVGARVVGVNNNNELRTFAGVKAGDHLVLTQNDPTSFNFTLNALANAPQTNGTNRYDVLTTCGNSSLSPGSGAGGSGSPDPGGSVTINGCATINLVIVAINQNVEGTTTTGILYHPDLAVSADATVALTDADPYAAPTPRSFTYTNTPVASLTLSHWLVGARGKLGPFGGPVGGTVTLQEPTIGGTTSITDTSFQFGRSEHHVVDWGAVAAAYTLDPTGLLLPGFTNDPSYDQPGNRVTWTEDTGAAPDLSITAINISRGSLERSWRWVITAPYTAGQLAFPTLPTDVLDWNPAANDGVQVESTTSAKVPGGYDAVRAFAINLALDAPEGASTIPVGASGRAVFVRFVPLPRIGAIRRLRQ